VLKLAFQDSGERTSKIIGFDVDFGVCFGVCLEYHWHCVGIVLALCWHFR